MFDSGFAIRTLMSVSLWSALAACGSGKPTSAPPSADGSAPKVAPAAYAAELRREGDRLYEQKRFADAGRVLARAIEVGATDDTTAYNAACSFALAGQIEPAFRYLELAIHRGFRDADHAASDTDLDSLHEDARWPQMLDRINTKEAQEEARLTELATRASLPTLDKAAMYADFDALVATITEFSPQLGVRKTVTGIDPLRDAAEIRARIESVRSTAEFALLIKSAITVFQDGHTSLLRLGYMRNTQFKDLGITEQAIALAPKYDELYAARDAGKKLAIPIKYVAGDYYTLADIRYEGRRIPRGAKVTHADGEPIHSFVTKLRGYIPMMRWDLERGRYYSDRFYRADKFSPADRLALTFAPRHGRPMTISFALRDEILAPTRPVSRAKKVSWFDDLGVLYIRMPDMNVEDTAYYPRAIKQTAKGRQVRKVIFDIRDNPGGGDGVWTSALAAVIPQSIETTTLMAFNTGTRVVDRLFWLRDAQTFKPEFLPNIEFRAVSGTNRIDPDADSIRYPGRVYVLQNENIYSSAGAFAAVAAKADNVVNVGGRTGWLLGRGVNPLVFELPSSKMLFRVEPAIDFTGAKTAAGVYHDDVELLVEPTLDQAIKRSRFAGDPFSKTFLATDPVFRRALTDTSP